MSINFYISTLGCKVNQYESQALRETWKELGWQECEKPDPADLVLVNSCAVTAAAVADVRSQVRRLHTLAPQAKILIMGCSAEVQFADMQKLPGVVRVIRTAEKDNFYHNPLPFLEAKITDCLGISHVPAAVVAARSRAGVLPHLELGLGAAPGDALESVLEAGPVLEPASKLGAKRAYPPFIINNYNRARAVLKVQDGCSHFCTYCIVPLARGPAVSRSPYQVLQEARRLLAAGFNEITLSGINLSQYTWQHEHEYRDDRGEQEGQANITNESNNAERNARFDFWDLVEFLEQHLAPPDSVDSADSVDSSGPSSSKITSIAHASHPPYSAGRVERADQPKQHSQPKQPKQADQPQTNSLPASLIRPRFRISSLEPGQLNDRALDILGRSKLICPQLHISLQSGSPSVLKRMGRGHYNPAGLVDFCAGLKKIWPHFGLGADLLVGFPGETEAEFAETQKLVQALPLTYAHVFPFSARPGTRAASMPGSVDKPTRTKRAAILRELTELKKQAFLELLLAKFKHKPLHIILESRETGLGVSEYYAECRLLEVPPGVRAKACLQVIAVAVEGERLLVKAQS